MRPASDPGPASRPGATENGTARTTRERERWSTPLTVIPMVPAGLLLAAGGLAGLVCAVLALALLRLLVSGVGCCADAAKRDRRLGWRTTGFALASTGLASIAEIFPEARAPVLAGLLAAYLGHAWTFPRYWASLFASR